MLPYMVKLFESIEKRGFMTNPFEHSILALRVPTDTAHPQEIVPIYLIHTLEHPFCPLPGCWCRTDQTRIALILEAIEQGEFNFQEADHFVEGKTL